jgi:carboxypeptidase T
MTRYRITINGPKKAAMVDLVRKYDIEVFDHGIRFAPDIGYTVTAFATPQEIQKLRQSGYHVVQHQDADRLGKLRQRQVGVGNRYAHSAWWRSLRLSKGGNRYLNVDEVESAIGAAAAGPYSNIVKLIALVAYHMLNSLCWSAKRRQRFGKHRRLCGFCR